MPVKQGQQVRVARMEQRNPGIRAAFPDFVPLPPLHPGCSDDYIRLPPSGPWQEIAARGPAPSSSHCSHCRGIVVAS
jgi:hypothetical protein